MSRNQILSSLSLLFYQFSILFFPLTMNCRIIKIYKTFCSNYHLNHEMMSVGQLRARRIDRDIINAIDNACFLKKRRDVRNMTSPVNPFFKPNNYIVSHLLYRLNSAPSVDMTYISDFWQIIKSSFKQTCHCVHDRLILKNRL